MYYDILCVERLLPSIINFVDGQGLTRMLKNERYLPFKCDITYACNPLNMI